VKEVAAAGQQTNAANATQISAAELGAVVRELLAAAGNLNGAAANAKTALLPSNIHNAAKHGARQTISRQ
jgi:hypothetical protein